ncbi:hypothetical protein ACO22_07138 [Paracoccidioides brasiliensis]|uniref:Uncharacterized protein n=1 Tax=Paracoccidioides brasiliensis TaxID=121759 RepID=A0A1D2J5G6_PARBR|nr:hypothetical protein ACO22_07138 [Paracoccidioides brasiliensis]ODH46655.1 hypothetical protein GX48_07265 [Paracoccidioides brasiliensis]
MAQKAAKTLAARNATLLNRTHLTTLSLHLLYLLLHHFFNRPRSLIPYFLLTFPTLLIEFYLERLGRPRYNATDGSLQSAGEDLDAPGLTEYTWDVLYWTWGCMGAVCVFNDRAWWLWVVVPLYTVWSLYTTFLGVQEGMQGMGGGVDDGAGAGAGVRESKRQKKLEKRGGQKVRYR